MKDVDRDLHGSSPWGPKSGAHTYPSAGGGMIIPIGICWPMSRVPPKDLRSSGVLGFMTVGYGRVEFYSHIRMGVMRTVRTLGNLVCEDRIVLVLVMASLAPVRTM